MPSLAPTLRNLLESTVINAREDAEKAAKAALIRLAVHQKEPFAALSPANRRLRKLLRAEARRLGEPAESQARDSVEPYPPLVAEVAYAQWHRMLFARFLAENGFLMHPQGVAVTLEECAALAAEESEPDGWMLAARYAAAMLPGIFRTEDPAMQVRFDASGRLSLERRLAVLPPALFTADDSLGWVYQFWQAKRKKEVNASGIKIGGADISPVTQLFTEHYMVQFLLHNSLGAWWAARHPGASLPTDLDYLRRNEDGSPAAGGFDAWPRQAADLRVLDPCCGSGHFLVAAFALLCRFRMAEEGLSERDAGDAVLRENLFGLELDPRCTQIAAFALALAAWKTGGYRALPLPNIACAGLPVGQNAYEFTHLADGDADRENLLRQLYHLFHNAPDLGSLIDPRRVATEETLFPVQWESAGPLLDAALSRERADDPAAAIFGATARGVARAAEYLTREYHLVVTNVPYLARGKQDAALRRHVETYHGDAKADLATAFTDRCLRFCAPGGAIAVVTPQNWLFLGSYKALRQRLLKTATWNAVALLGENGFQSVQAAGAFTALFVLTKAAPSPEHSIFGLDASAPRNPAEKSEILRCAAAQRVSQAGQLQNPDARVALEDHVAGTLLEKYATSYQGISPADFPHYGRCFWEVNPAEPEWHRLQSTVQATMYYGGREHTLWMNEDFYDAVSAGSAYVRGSKSWGKVGVTVSAMRNLPVTLYCGQPSDTNVAIVLPCDPEDLPAIWAFCSSPEYHTAVRRIDQALKVTNASLVKVPFDLERWQAVAAERYPDGLPAPYSNDPTQWIFKGHPAGSTDPLQVAVARLLGYRWPENGADNLDSLADADGIVCLPPVNGELPAAQRLGDALAAAFGGEWSPGVEERLLTGAGFGGRGLETWLREGFFAQHCRLFHNRPFVWQIWDGRKDGFSALLNYHRLTRANLERLTYTYLQNWIGTQRESDSRGVAGANARLVAAIALQEKLKAIAEGEPPYDIYVRWKPFSRQPVGWDPDINDGVRLNIRPFVLAGILRAKFSVNWNKDRGTNSDGSQRLNDIHLTRSQKI